MQKLKKFVRSGRNPLAQIVRRLSESTSENGVKGINFFMKFRNNAYIIDAHTCCEVLDSHDGKVLYDCSVFVRSEPFFINPCGSRTIGMYKVDERHAQ